MRLSCISLAVANVPSATAFYQAWGWDLLKQAPDYAHFAVNGQKSPLTLALYPMASINAVLGQSATVAPARQSILTISYVTPQLVDETYHALLALGATAISPPRTQAWGLYAGFITDLDGHPWELLADPNV
jgi:uncharacterized protein